MEVARRVALLVGCFAAVWCFLWLAPSLVRVDATDFAALQSRRRPWSEDRKLSLEAFVEKETRDRSERVSGEAWGALLAAARRVRAGEAAGPEFAGRLGTMGTSLGLWFLPSEEPIADLSAREFRYVLVSDGEDEGWLDVSFRTGGNSDSAPAFLRRPLRGLAIRFLVGGILLYAVLPRRRGDERTLLYARASAGIGPDLLGTFLAVVFFALPILIVSTNASSGAIFDAGWWPVYAVLWFLALFGVAIVGIAAWYRSRRLVLHDGGLRIDAMRGTRTIPFSSIRSARVDAVKAPRWLRVLMRVGALFSIQVAGHALILEGRTDPVLVIETTDGPPARIMLTGLDDPDRLLEHLRSGGVAVID